MKKLILIAAILLFLTACAHKPIASPEEVNRYLEGLTGDSLYSRLIFDDQDTVSK